ncbi:hypothetical protein BDZ94DRAFT_1316518, partial [Collybia nuda]
DGKSQQYAVLADSIFAKDPVQSSAFKVNPTKFATAVKTRLRRLKADYQGFLEQLGKTGAGLDPSKLRGDLANLQDSFCEQWPWWDDFHAFWRELPSYHTVGVASSEHGTGHAAAAADLYAPPSPEEDEDEPMKPDDVDNEVQDVDADAKGEGDGESSLYEQHPETPLTFPSSHSSLPDITPPPDFQSNRQKSKSTSASTKSTPASSRSSTVQPPRKAANALGWDSGAAKAAAQNQARNHKKNAMVDKFNENRDNETVRLGQKRAMVHAEQMGRLENKKLKNKGLTAAALLQRTPVTPLHCACVSNQPNVGFTFPPGHAVVPPAFIPALGNDEAGFTFGMDGVTFGLESGFLDMLHSPLNNNDGLVMANNHVSTL